MIELESILLKVSGIKQDVEPAPSGPSTKNLEPSESGKAITDVGGSHTHTLQLPKAEPGLRYSFCVAENWWTIVKAGPDDLICNVGTSSADGGTIESNTMGSTLTLLAIKESDGTNSGVWMVVSRLGTWSVPMP